MPLRSPAWLLALLLPALTAGRACAQPSAEAIAKAVRDLSSPRFTVREKASALLWSAGRVGEMALLRALPKGDLEMARRAEKIFEQFRWGIYPDTPKDVLPLIAKYRADAGPAKPGLLRQLFQRGRDAHWLVARLLAAEPTQQARTNAGRGFLHKDVEEELHARLARQDFTKLEDLLEIRLMTGAEKPLRDYAVFLLLSGRMGQASERYAGYGQLPGRKREALVLAHLHRVKGDLAAARRAAEKAGERELFQAVLVEQGDWKALSALGDKLVGEDGLPDFRAFFHRLAGDRPAFESATADLIKLGRGRAAGDDTRWWEAKALFLNDRPEDALAVLAAGGDDTLALDVLVRQRRFRDAFRLLDRFHSQDGQGEAWAALRRARLLHHLGEKEAAVKLLEGARKGVEGRFLPGLHAALLQTERELGRPGEALEACARLLQRWPPPVAKQPDGSRYTGRQYAEHLLAGLFEDAGAEAGAWWAFLREKHSRAGLLGWPESGDTRATLRQVRAVLQGKLPKAEVAALVRAMRAAAVKRPDAERNDWLAALAESSRRAGREDLQRECLEAAADTAGDPAAFARLAKFLLGKGRGAEVAAVCARGHKRHPEDPVLLLLHGHALTRLGKQAEGRRLEDSARLLPLGDEGVRHAVATTLAELGRHEDARREFELITRSGYRTAWATRDAWRELSKYALRAKDDLRAAACWERWYLGVLGGGSFFLENEPYVWVPYRLHFLRARGLLAAGDAAGAWAEIQTCLRLLPGETDTAIAFVPALARKGRAREADELFGKTLAFYEAICKDYPRCGWAHNGLAWLAARCRRQLDAALAHARQAVKLVPDNAGFLDSLAEIHFQRGERGEALRLMRRCIALAPDRDYYRRQLKRFEAGDRATEVPD
jgi:tetratricopeptide (TPR) repeat protein